MEVLAETCVGPKGAKILRQRLATRPDGAPEVLEDDVLREPIRTNRTPRRGDREAVFNGVNQLLGRPADERAIPDVEPVVAMRLTDEVENSSRTRLAVHSPETATPAAAERQWRFRSVATAGSVSTSGMSTPSLKRSTVKMAWISPRRSRVIALDRSAADDSACNAVAATPRRRNALPGTARGDRQQASARISPGDTTWSSTAWSTRWRVLVGEIRLLDLRRPRTRPEKFRHRRSVTAYVAR